MTNWTAPKPDTGDDLPSIEQLRAALYLDAAGELRWTLEPKREDFPHPSAWAAARRRAGDLAERETTDGRKTVALFGRTFDAFRVRRAMKLGHTDLSRITLAGARAEHPED